MMRTVTTAIQTHYGYTVLSHLIGNSHNWELATKSLANTFTHLIKNSLNSESVISKDFDSVNWESNSAPQAKILSFCLLRLLNRNF